MKVLYVGNFEPDHSTENDVRRAFEHLGWEVDRWQERDFIHMAREGTSPLKPLPSLITRTLASQPDLVLHTLTQGNYPPDTVLGLWEVLRTEGIPTASIHLDRFYGLSSPKDSGPQRHDLPRLHPMFKVDHVFTADGDSDELFAADGVNHHWLPPAVRYDEARDIEPDATTATTFAPFSVGFCGAKGYHPEHDRPGLIAALEARYGDRFVRVAGDTSYGTVRGEALNRMYATVPVWVGDSCFAGTSSRYFSDRFFETWGRGGFLVFPWLDGLGALLGEVYPHWDPYDDREELFAAVDYAVAHPEHRAEVRAAIAAEVRAHHTYVNRVEEILAVVFPSEEATSDAGSLDDRSVVADRGAGALGPDPLAALTPNGYMTAGELALVQKLGDCFTDYVHATDGCTYPGVDQIRGEFASRVHDLQGRVMWLAARRAHSDVLR